MSIKPAHLARAALVTVATLVGVPAFAQVDLSGIWRNLNHQDWMERGPGPDAVDYSGIPLNDEGRARALSYNYSALSQPEHQCGYYTPFYIVLGPFGLNIRSEADPITGKIVAWKIGGWIDRDITTIWMDGRPHPPTDGFHSYGGFTTGVWEGDTLTTYTTHIKANYLRRNGTPASDRATMRTHMVRHGDLLTITAIFEDPIYLSEPHVYSQSWKLDPRLNLPPTASPCEPIAELPSDAAAVPHYLPGQNPFINEMTQMYNIPLEAVLGGAETRYPEFRKKLKGYVAPAVCVRYCCGPGQPPGQRCIIDGSGRPTLPPQ